MAVTRTTEWPAPEFEEPSVRVHANHSVEIHIGGNCMCFNLRDLACITFDPDTRNLSAFFDCDISPYMVNIQNPHGVSEFIEDCARTFHFAGENILLCHMGEAGFTHLFRRAALRACYLSKLEIPQDDDHHPAGSVPNIQFALFGQRHIDNASFVDVARVRRLHSQVMDIMTSRVCDTRNHLYVVGRILPEDIVGDAEPPRSAKKRVKTELT
jgi:hypothetical protein